MAVYYMAKEGFFDNSKRRGKDAVGTSFSTTGGSLAYDPYYEQCGTSFPVPLGGQLRDTLIILPLTAESAGTAFPVPSGGLLREVLIVVAGTTDNAGTTFPDAIGGRLYESLVTISDSSDSIGSTFPTPTNGSLI